MGYSLMNIVTAVGLLTPMLMLLTALVLHAVLNGSMCYTPAHTASQEAATSTNYLHSDHTAGTAGTRQSHTSTSYLEHFLCQSPRELLDNMGSITTRAHFCLCLSLQVILGEAEGIAKRQGRTATLREPNWAGCLQKEFHVSVRQAYALFVATRR